MDNFVITKLMTESPIIKDKFIGVFSIDTIPKWVYKKTNKCFIFNTDPSSLPGEHWIAVYVKDKNQIEYFDSFGNEPLIFNKNITYNSFALQSAYTTLCGEYCITFLINRCLGIKFDEFMRYFSKTDHYYNDRIILEWIKLYFRDSYKYRKPCYSIFSQICEEQCNCYRLNWLKDVYKKNQRN